MESDKLRCYHLYTGELTGEKSDLSLSLQQGIKNGLLNPVSEFGGVCDWLMPRTREFNGQQVGCVGPNDSRCPDPESATLNINFGG